MPVYHHVVVWPNILSTTRIIQRKVYVLLFQRRVNSENQAASSRRAKDEEPVVCSRTASKLIVEIVKVIGNNWLVYILLFWICRFYYPARLCSTQVSYIICSSCNSLCPLLALLLPEYNVYHCHSYLHSYHSTSQHTHKSWISQCSGSFSRCVRSLLVCCIPSSLCGGSFSRPGLPTGILKFNTVMYTKWPVLKSFR